jgi:hypothetical protein
MVKAATIVFIIFFVLIVACGNSSDSNSSAPSLPKAKSNEDGGVSLVDSAAWSAPVVPEPEPNVTRSLSNGIVEEGSSAASTLESFQRKVISLASVAIEVEVVEDSVSGVRAIAESVGGFVERLSSSSEDVHQQANVTIRVPQTAFYSALERIEVLGKVLNRSVGTEDVSEHFIDLSARSKSSLREEQSLLSLLEKANTVSEVLTIERELARVRSEIERLQGQLNFLNRRVELATINIQLYAPKEQIAEPPSAFLTVAVSDVTGSVKDIKALVANLDGVLDSVFLSLHDGEEKANLSLRVFAPDFKQALAFIEGEGDVRIKQLQETTVQVQDDIGAVGKLNAHISVALIEKKGLSLLILFVAPVGGVIILALFFYLAFRAGRKRAGINI